MLCWPTWGCNSFCCWYFPYFEASYCSRSQSFLGILAHLLRMVMEPKYLAFRRWLDTPCSSSDVRWLDPYRSSLSPSKNSRPVFQSDAEVEAAYRGGNFHGFLPMENGEMVQTSYVNQLRYLWFFFKLLAVERIRKLHHQLFRYFEENMKESVPFSWISFKDS